MTYISHVLNRSNQRRIASRYRAMPLLIMRLQFISGAIAHVYGNTLSRDMSLLLIRSDSSVNIGGGHVMRCLALAQAWVKEGGRAAFATATMAPSLRQRVLNEGLSCFSLFANPGTLADANETRTLARLLAAGVIVVDGFHFGYEFRRVLQEVGLKTVGIDDNGKIECCMDQLIINQNPHASGAYYRYGDGRSRLLLGSDYILLRREFLGMKRRPVQSLSEVCRILVTLGAADRDNATVRVARCLGASVGNKIEIMLVIGGENRYAAAIEATCSGRPNTRAIRDPGTGMADLMAKADIAVCAGGTTMWELAFVGVPFVCVVTADNQRQSAFSMAARGFPTLNVDQIERNLPRIVIQLIENAVFRQTLQRRGQCMVDGCGASRVCRVIKDLGNSD